MIGSQGNDWNGFYKNFLFRDSKGFIYIAANSISGIPSGTKTDPNCILNDTTIPPHDMWIIKLDSMGNQIWDRTLGGLNIDVEFCMYLRKNGNLLITGFSNSKQSCEKSQNNYQNDYDGWTVELTTDSEVVWNRRLGTNCLDNFYEIAEAPDSSILLGGYAECLNPGHDLTDTNVGFFDDIWFVKCDKNGKKIWDQKYGSTGIEYITSIIPLSDYSYIIIGRTEGQKSGDVSDSSFSEKFDPTYFKLDNWILKIDSSGNKIWDKRYGCLKADDAPGTALLNSQGNLVIGATLGLSSLQGIFEPCNDGVADTVARGSVDAWIYMIDTSSGNILNEKRFGGDLHDGILQIIEMNDKGYLVLCNSNSHAGFEKSENPKGNQQVTHFDIWLVRMDSAFNIIWDKTIGGLGNEYGNVIVLNDSTFIIASTVDSGDNFDIGVSSIDTVGFPWKYDIWLSKWYIPNPANLQEMSLASFNLHPNPATDILYITLQNAKNKTYHLHVQDMQGRMVVQRQLTITNSNTIMLESHDWQPGVYVVNIEGVSKKVVKL
ncbi:MAG: T9SS type A sorting domain-containing protein [Bacteroidetes bacterium]|nr:T9SS type A sorting domain-containing protein [Bacteroidota bacterium]